SFSQRVLALFEKLKKDYTAISKRMRLQNEASSSVVVGFKDIGNKQGFMNKFNATGKLLGTALSKVPGVKQTKNMITHAGSVSAGLEEQFNLLIKVSQEIYDMIDGDNGIKSIKDTIRTNYNDYGKKLIDIKDKKIKLNSRFEKIKQKKYELIDTLLEQYHADNFDSIDTLKLDSSSMVAYQNIEQIDMEIEDMEYTIPEYREMEERLVNLRDGTKTQLKTIGIYLIQGKNMYNATNDLIENTATGKLSTKLITTMEGLIIEASTISTNLIENFNDILEKTAKHAETLTEESNNLVPKFVYRGSSLGKVEESNNQSLKYLKNSGQLRKYQKAISGTNNDQSNMIGYNKDN
ncbi:MAG: hypothetical protein U9R34_06145, partial [Nanoarchaeota archaeon]|nr:hypothetical protein [Nanoarchaeota archaeon]